MSEWQGRFLFALFAGGGDNVESNVGVKGGGGASHHALPAKGQESAIAEFLHRRRVAAAGRK